MDDWKTRETLLDRIRHDESEDAWDDFCFYYAPFIEAVLRNLRCPNNWLDDVKQLVMIKLWKSLPKFVLDPERAKFRTWMGRIIKNTLIDHHRTLGRRSQKEKNILNDSDDQEWFEPSIPSNIDEMIESEWRVNITQRAIASVTKRFSGKAIQVFQLSVQGLGPDEVAEKCELKKNSVYRLNKRVQKALQEEIRSLNSHLLGDFSEGEIP